MQALALHRPSYGLLGWPAACDFRHPRDYIGFDGAAASARVGHGHSRARAQGTDRLPVAVLGDGDYLMGATALWTGVHQYTGAHRHRQQRIVLQRRAAPGAHGTRAGRPVENR
jgi:hypothetical protein